MIVAGQTVELELPARMSVRLDVRNADSHNQQTAIRVVAATLFLCWPTAQAKGGPKYRGDILAYGGDVIDFLLAKGAELKPPEPPEKTLNDIVVAGNAASKLVLGSMVTKEDLEEAMGKSRARTGTGFESSSQSSGSQAET